MDVVEVQNDALHILQLEEVPKWMLDRLNPEDRIHLDGVGVLHYERNINDSSHRRGRDTDHISLYDGLALDLRSKDLRGILDGLCWVEPFWNAFAWQRILEVCVDIRYAERMSRICIKALDWIRKREGKRVDRVEGRTAL